MSAFTCWRRVLLVAACVIPTGCGGGGALRVQDVTPETVPELESANAQRPGDAVTLTRLGVGYFRANRYPEARAVLDSALVIAPQSGIAAIYLGMTAEAQGDFTTARAAYQRYIEIGRSNELRNAARQRLALVGRRELEYQARQALARESELSQEPPHPNTIAVMPFAYTGTNAEIAPLSRGFAQLIVTDLAKSRQVTVLERERMQAMVDEMRLGEQQRADPATAARSGRLLRASRVVQGSLTDRDDNLRVDAAVVDVSTAGIAAPASGENLLTRLFDLEKQLVYDIFNGLGITLTDAERAAIEQRPTQNLQAFLAWSRGLEAEDRGDYAGARDLFEQATRLDPSFMSARQSAQEAGDLSNASAQSATDMEATVTQAAGAELGSTPPTSDALNQASAGVTPSQTPAAGSGTETGSAPPAPPTTQEHTPGQQQTLVPQRAVVVIVIRRP